MLSTTTLALYRVIRQLEHSLQEWTMNPQTRVKLTKQRLYIVRTMNTYLAKYSIEVQVFTEVQAWGEYRQVRHFPELSLTSLSTTQLKLAMS